MRFKETSEQGLQTKMQRAMDAEQVRQLVAYLLRKPAVINAARSILKPDHFTKEPHFRLLLEVLYELLDASGGDAHTMGLVSYLDFYDAVRDRVKNGYEQLSKKYVNWLLWRPPLTPAGMNNGVIYWAYKELKGRDIDPQLGLKLLKRFLRERALMPSVADLADAVSGGKVITNYAEVADAAAMLASRIEAVSEVASSGMRPPAGMGQPIALRATGVTFIDKVFHGGAAATEVYGVSGVTGGGKSTLAYQTGVSYAELHTEELVLHFSFEDNLQRMFNRVWGYAGYIPKETLAKMGDPLDAVRRGILSSTTKCKGRSPLKPYELAMYKSGAGRLSGDIRGEYERLMSVWDGYQNYRLFDMTAAGRGEGSLDEIASLIHKTLDEYKGIYDRVGLVIIDSIDLVVENYLTAQNLPLDKLTTQYLTRFPRQVRRKIGTPFGAATFLMNQIAGAQTKRHASYRMSHADAAGSKSWANGCDFHFGLGTTEIKGEGKTKAKVGQITCSKARRTGESDVAVTVKLVGEIGYWEDCSQEYRVENGVIVAANDINLVDPAMLGDKSSMGELFDAMPRLY